MRLQVRMRRLSVVIAAIFFGLTFTVHGQLINLPPVANSDQANTTKGIDVSFNVVANDSDADGTVDPASVDLDLGKSGVQDNRKTSDGDYSVDNKGIVTFKPKRDFVGSTSIQYNIKDNKGLPSLLPATITVSVADNNASPVANDDNTTTNENTNVTINVVANDTDDKEVDAATVDLNPGGGIDKTKDTDGGKFTVNASGIVTFDPKTDYVGTASCQYTVRDNVGATSNQATVTVIVNAVDPVNNAPVANNDQAYTRENTNITLNVVVNDTDNDGTINASTIDLNPGGGIDQTIDTNGGKFSVNASGKVTFEPKKDFAGQTSCRYTVKDNDGAISNQAIITITVNRDSDLPIANNDDTSTDANTDVTLNIVANDTDVKGTIDATTVDLNTIAAGIQKNNSTTGGQFSVNASGIVTFVPVLDFTGITSISYTVRDNSGKVSNAATITIAVGQDIDTKLEGQLDIPTAFTPNGDGANETWKISSREGQDLSQFPEARIRVYDKRGALLFDASGFENQWDGTYQGKVLPADSYYYTILLNDDSEKYQGVVTILR
jgi:gliding motility-associated-like protein